jgi:hypothetical protein
MADLLLGLIDLVAGIWRADSKMRELTLGESRLERSARDSVAWLCGGVIAVLALCLLL